MTRFTVNGRAYVMITTEVEADTPEEAIEKAYDECADLDSYCGNGGDDKLVGVDNDNVSIFPDGLEWEEAERV